MSVFEDASPYAVHLPPRAKLTVTAITAVELGVAGAPASGKLSTRLIEPDSIRRSDAAGAPMFATFAISCPKMSPPSPFWSSRSGLQVETLRAILPISFYLKTLRMEKTRPERRPIT